MDCDVGIEAKRTGTELHPQRGEALLFCPCRIVTDLGETAVILAVENRCDDDVGSTFADDGPLGDRIDP
jgi:hypothetical protein